MTDKERLAHKMARAYIKICFEHKGLDTKRVYPEHIAKAVDKLIATNPIFTQLAEMALDSNLKADYHD